MTRRISLVAVCCSSASARRFSSWRREEASFASDLRRTAFAGFAPRRIGLSLTRHRRYDRAAIDDKLSEGALLGKCAGIG